MHLGVAPATPPGAPVFMLQDNPGAFPPRDRPGASGSAPPGLPRPGLLVHSWPAPAGQHGYVMHSPTSPDGANAAATPPRGALRKGKWTAEEEVYTERVIRDFNEGLLAVPTGTTLRSYLSEKLNCDPMRITKKYAGSSCIGKRIFSPCERTPENAERQRRAQKELTELETAFRTKLESSRITRVQGNGTPGPRMPSSMDMPRFNVPNPLHPPSMALSPSFSMANSFPTSMSSSVNSPPMLHRSMSANQAITSIRPVPSLPRTASQPQMPGAMPFLPRLPDKPFLKPSPIDNMMKPEVISPPAMEKPKFSVTKAPPGSNLAELSKDDHDACGLLLGFINSVRSEGSSDDLKQADGAKAAKREGSARKTAIKAEKKAKKRVPKKASDKKEDAGRKGKGQAAPPAALTAQAVDQAGRKGGKRPFPLCKAKADDAENHADDEAETSSSDYHTDNESSSSTERGSMRSFSPDQARKELAKHDSDTMKGVPQLDLSLQATISNPQRPGDALPRKRQRVDV